MPRVHNGEQLVLTPKDAKLISYLARHQHKSPFNHAFATFHIKAPIFVARQLQKHEYMPWNEISRRYVDEDPEYYKPKVWRRRSKDKKIGDLEENSPDMFNTCPKYFFEGQKSDPYCSRNGFKSMRMAIGWPLVTFWSTVRFHGATGCPP